ncbi:MAG: OmpA family protein [Holophaga sp.]|nr:OmpA family protein [Holophaga sp.]
MRFVRNLVPLAVILALGVGVGCKKPAPAPAEPAAPAATAPAAPDVDAQKRADEDAARRKAEAEAEAARQAAAAAELARTNKFKADAEAALKDINFEFDKSDIREVDKPKLQAIADFLKANSDAKIQIAGNCDERGTVEYNLALGERRAHAAQSYLTGLGVVDARLTTISYGKEKPKVQGHDDESWLINRNCQFTLQ